MITRTLPGLLALLTSACAPVLHSAPEATLKVVYRDAFLVGTALNEAIASGSDTASLRLVLQHFNTITAENVLKAGPINPEPGVYNWGPADAFVELGEQHGLFMVGHTLVWHNQTPAWFFQDAQGRPNTREAQIERLRSHIQAVAGRYAGRIHAWDVVNEVIDNDGSYRPTTWVRGIGSGDDLVRFAFRFASEYAPGAELYYNDFNAWRPAKRDGIVRLVRLLQKEGIRIDGVGMQGHWGLNYPKREYIEAAIDSFAALGVKVMITELDVDVLPLTREGQIIGTGMSDPQFQLEEFKEYLDPYRNGLPAEVQQQLADRYAEIFDILYRKRDAIARVTLWGVHDGMSWKNGYPVPGRTNYPLLWDRNRQPKPALDAVLRVPQRARTSAAALRAPGLLASWPEGAAPAEVGRRVAQNWAGRKFLFEAGATDRWGSHVHYAEVATWYGALTFARAVGDQDLTRRLVLKYDTLIDRHGAQRISREAHVDFSVFGALPLELYLQTKAPQYLELGRGFADRQWDGASADGISREARYWVDDMYMLPLVQLQAYRATGDRVYLDRTALTMAAYLGRLQQPNGLFHHGEGSPFYWGRGNGWIAAGMAELLRELPLEHPRRAVILNGYRRMMDALRVHQSPEGLWRQLVDRPELWIEASGSAMFAFAIITGVKEGWLDAGTFEPVARRAWLGLTALVDATGNVSDVCVGTGKALAEVGADAEAQYRYYAARDRRTGDLHGQAPLLWAATALLR